MSEPCASSSKIKRSTGVLAETAGIARVDRSVADNAVNGALIKKNATNRIGANPQTVKNIRGTSQAKQACASTIASRSATRIGRPNGISFKTRTKITKASTATKT